MNNENNIGLSGGNKTLIKVIIIASVLTIYYSIMSMLGPARKIEELKKEFEAKESVPSKVDDRLFTDSTYLKLLKERAFLQSKVSMASTDSIYLSIVLNDSTANLEISGVVVHKSKISSISISKILLAENESTILTLFSSPFTISGLKSTIRKEPLIIKMAPKDTSEYKPDIMPDTSITEPVYYIMEMTNGTRIYVYQEEKEKFNDRITLFRFDIIDRLRDTWSSIKRVVLFKVPEYHPFIKMKIPRADAKIIYRAIPRNGQVGIYK
jgi:hypothetical protein